MASFEIVEPETIDEAFAFLDSDDPAVRPIGGGTALMLMMKTRIFKPERLVSLCHLDEPFRGIEKSADGTSFRIGAMTRFAELEHHPEIAEFFPVIPRTMLTLANIRVRNVASIGGNLAHADPHLDLPPVWTALDAKARIVNPKGERVIGVEEIFAGYYETTLEHGDIIAELTVPIRAGWRTSYVKVTTRAAHDWPALGLALSVKLVDGKVEDARLVLSAATDKPTRLCAAEDALRGTSADADAVRAVAEAAVGEVTMDTDAQGSADYKLHLLRVYIARGLAALVAEAGA
jgi:carbon-monoxide dehydrogenase medium subunit